MATDGPRRQTLVLVAVLFEGGLAVLAWAIGWLVAQPPAENLYWDLRDLALGTVGTLPLLAMFLLCVTVRWQPLQRIRRLCEEIIQPFFAAATVLDLAVIALVAGVAEELLFRGALQPLLARWLGAVWAGLVATSVLFGLVHLLTWIYGVLATLMGAYLGWLYLATGNLLPAMIAHGLYDFIALLMLLRVAGPSPQNSQAP